MDSPDQPSLLAISGPTGVGKSALALHLAQRFSGEIVSADSRQVYIGMDVATAKPSTAEQAQVRHHLIDLVRPDQPYSLAAFQQQANAAIAAIQARGRLPILVGGTPQYVNAVLEGWLIPDVQPDYELRARLEQRADGEGASALYDELVARDPAAAAKILPGNIRRIIRALEVIYTTGGRFSEQQGKRQPPWRSGKLALTATRAELYRRIDGRIDGWMAGGLVQEIEHLLAAGYGFGLPSMSGLGYRQFSGYFAGQSTLEATAQQLKWDTHRFVRHQYTWFRRDDSWCWRDTTDGSDLDGLAAMISRWLAGGALCLDSTPPPQQEGRSRRDHGQADQPGGDRGGE